MSRSWLGASGASRFWVMCRTHKGSASAMPDKANAQSMSSASVPI